MARINDRVECPVCDGKDLDCERCDGLGIVLIMITMPLEFPVQVEVPIGQRFKLEGRAGVYVMAEDGKVAGVSDRCKGCVLDMAGCGPINCNYRTDKKIPIIKEVVL